MTETYTLPDAIKHGFKPASDTFADFAEQVALDLIDCHVTPSVAGSTVAHMLLRAAWIIAASGRLTDGETPDPQKFVAAAREWTERISFKADDEEKPE